MATFLSKLFKPKWQSKHTATRLEAIKELDPNSAEGQEILQQLADNDAQPSVKKNATLRINDAQTLIKLHGQSKDELKSQIEQQLYELANAQSLSIFDLITDSKLLTEMIIKSSQADAFLSGLARIEDSESLLEIALTAKTAKLRQAAAELIEKETELTSLLNKAKSKDKSVYQIAKSKLSVIRHQIAEQGQQKQDVEKVLSDITALANTEALQHFEAKLNNLVKRWDSVSFSADDSQRKEFSHYAAECQARIDQISDEKHAAEEQERIIQTGGDEQEATLYTLSETLQRFTQSPPAFQDLPSMP